MGFAKIKMSVECTTSRRLVVNRRFPILFLVFFSVHICVCLREYYDALRSTLNFILCDYIKYISSLFAFSLALSLKRRSFFFCFGSFDSWFSFHHFVICVVVSVVSFNLNWSKTHTSFEMKITCGDPSARNRKLFRQFVSTTRRFSIRLFRIDGIGHDDVIFANILRINKTKLRNLFVRAFSIFQWHNRQWISRLFIRCCVLFASSASSLSSSLYYFTVYDVSVLFSLVQCKKM